MRTQKVKTSSKAGGLGKDPSAPVSRRECSMRLDTADTANVGIVDLHGLWGVLGPFHFFFVYHNLLDEKP